MRSKKNGRVGKTIYIGSRSSEKMIRIYDKAAEQNQEGVWIRYEIETKGDFADKCFRRIKEAGRILRGVLSQFKPVEKTHTRNTNCKVAGWWKEFCDDALILKIVRTKPEMTIQRIVTWAKKQVARNIFKMVEKLGMEIVYDLILIGEERQERLKWSGSAV